MQSQPADGKTVTVSCSHQHSRDSIFNTVEMDTSFLLFEKERNAVQLEGRINFHFRVSLKPRNSLIARKRSLRAFETIPTLDL
jgi:hypothetical protein